MDIKAQLEVIKRGAVEIINDEDLVAKLKKGKPLRVKAGFDPTAPDLHLGHTVLLQKMKQFQELGHHVTFLIGDFTARIGDPSGRSQLRPQLSDKEIKANIKTYEEQVFKVLDKKRTEVRYNSEWFSKMSIVDFARLGTLHTVARMLERDDFRNRYENGLDISILEFYYPLMQAYDSVVLKSDIELGGNDQKFNLLMGRTVQKRLGEEPQVTLTMPLLIGTDGVKKMSKSYGNYVGINEPAKEMYGKLMSISDELMWSYYELLSDKTLEEISKLKNDVMAGLAHPKSVKSMLAREMVERYHGLKDADRVAKEFEDVFSNKATPTDIEKFKASAGELLVDVIVESKMATSKSEARRLIQQGGVSINDAKVSDIAVRIEKGEFIFKVGKRKFLRVTAD